MVVKDTAAGLECHGSSARQTAGFRQYKDRIGRFFEQRSKMMRTILETSKTENAATSNAPALQPPIRGRKSRKAEAKSVSMATAADSLATTGAPEQSTDDGHLTSANMPTDLKPETSLPPLAPLVIASPKAATKAAMVIAALRSDKGVTIDSIMAMTDWQAHSVRGFLSGTVKKKLGLTVTRSKDANGQQRYSIVEPASDAMPQDVATATADRDADASGEAKALDRERGIIETPAGRGAHGGNDRRDDDGGNGKLYELPEAPDGSSDTTAAAIQATEA